MKKFYLLSMLFIASTIYGQSPIITMIMDGDCSGGNPKAIEIYADGAVDFSNYSLQKQSNGGAWGSDYDLSALGTITDEFVYVYADDPSFVTEFPTVTNSHAATTAVLSINGDDGIRIIETSSSNVIDQYAENGIDGSGTNWEYKDGYAKRNDNTGPDGAFVEANWTFYNGALDGLCGTTTYEVITNAGSYSSTPATTPTITTSTSTVSGIIQVLGNPSPEETIDVSGVELTDDITVEVTSGDFEISLTSMSNFGTTVTLPNVSGTVAATTIYVRLNGSAVANPVNGELTITSTNATDVVVSLEGAIVEYTPSTVGDVTTVDADGVGESIGEYVSLTGVLHCDDFRGSGYDIVLIDANNDGISIFSFDDLGTYSPVEGDEVTVEGVIGQYNGLLQIEPSSITVVSQGATLQTPTVVTTLDESTESQSIILENLNLVDGETMWPDNDNIYVTNGVDTFLVRVPSSSALANTATPTGTFNLMGLGKQYDSSSPYDSGYQIFPCSVIENVGVNTNVLANLTVYPNPVQNELNISNENGVIENVTIVSASGSVIYSSVVESNKVTVNTANFDAGIYFVTVRSENNVKTVKVVK
ncbi:T9SS type A sorting domain-containing protein [Brumimicrobium aurantiacum]|uniref:T9SS C-terminal target domain-containing protein n=1 Tax=Brumimicrobium aurantiacum TaxID=1737063 RepID=A0A3E1EZX7_9FLAO|nr:T9SS type A sorting domain-containing protein [Brumimicrobium aurantiacum]RFC55114.1 T9SS C-terminal target domain-containing protein [Brumimicrobium aurantiacum]